MQSSDAATRVCNLATPFSKVFKTIYAQSQNLLQDE